jgi:hypothetical protein
MAASLVQEIIAVLETLSYVVVVVLVVVVVVG